MTDVAEFRALIDKKSELENQIKDEAKGVFADISKEIFEKYGDKVGKFSWTQYTPYFNDGDPCEFSKNELCIFTPADIENEDAWEGSDEFSPYGGNGDKLNKFLYRRKSDGYETSGRWIDNRRLETDYEVFENPNFDPAWGEAYTAVNTAFNLLDDDTALALFGDHVQVIVTKDGVEAEEYSHD